MCRGVPTTNKHFSTSSSVASFNSKHSGRRRHQIPRVKGSVPEDCPHSRARITWASDLLAIDRMVPAFGLMTLLQQLTELRETFHLLDSRALTQGCSSGTARRRRWAGIRGRASAATEAATLPAQVHRAGRSPSPVRRVFQAAPSRRYD